MAKTGDAHLSRVLLASTGRRLLIESLGRTIEADPDSGLELVADPVHDVASTVDLCAKRRPDVLLVDVDGGSPTRTMDLVERLKDCSRHTKVLLLVGSRTDKELLLLDYVQAGADGFLDRASGIDSVLEGLRRAAAGMPVVLEGDVLQVLRRAAAERDSIRRSTALLRSLTTREVEILQLIADGFGNERIAGELHISARTVATHVQNIYRKIDAHSRIEAAEIAKRAALVDDGA